MGDLSVFIVFLLVVAILLRVDFIFYFVYVIVAIYGLSIWYTPRAAARLEIERRFNNRAFLGEKVSVDVAVQNTSRFPFPWIQISESIPARLQISGVPRFAFSIRGQETLVFNYSVHAARRGYYRIGPMQISSGDLFGFSEQTRFADAAYLTVYPRITQLSRLAIRARLPFGTLASQQRLFEDPARPAGVRPYHPGDSLRQINWKVSAHASRVDDKLMVRTLEPTISLESVILLNLDRDDYQRRTALDVSEWAIEVAASLAANLSESRQAVGLMTNGSDPLRGQEHRVLEALPFDKETGRLQVDPDDVESGDRLPVSVAPKTGRAHLMRLLEILARVELSRQVPYLSWATTITTQLSWGITVLAVTPKGDEAICNLLHQLLRSGYNPVLIVIEGQANFAEVRDRARRLGFSAFKITYVDDFRQITDYRGSMRAAYRG